ncbi:hypothetical protein DRE_03353 [Drechslerella stenobrocha 248]|uniref:alpha-1,2-Mannosidase n=1 Tax=Drechslerella stenobrocha 248 TaxID=1043628 RepID=W7HUP1_9PEZI|nr:hypothetical protein DRE_03353 [Drechslerella stenobrocha 248]
MIVRARPSRAIAFVFISLCLYLVYEIGTFCFSASSSLPNLTIPPGRRIQYPFREKGVGGRDEEKADAVRKVMERTWKLYKQKAFGFDEIKPASGGYRNSRNGWGATIVDSMTTTAVMGLSDAFADQYDWVVNHINFDEAKDLVDPFETTIRYLAALVSTVDLLEAGVITPPRPSFRQDILRQARSLADNLGPAFDTPTGMVWPRVNFGTKSGVNDDGRKNKYTRIHLARAGSHWLEYATLSQLTGDNIYLRNATKAWSRLVDSTEREEWPVYHRSPRLIWTGESVGSTRTLGAPDDSYYEYLIKAHLLFPSRASTKRYARRWLQAMTSAQKHLLSVSDTHPIHSFLLSYSKGMYNNKMGHLTCFIGGNLLLGAAYLNRADLLSFGKALVEGCRYSYFSTPSGIGPEEWSWTPRESKRNRAGQPEFFTGPVTAAQEKAWQQTGIWPTQANYNLRPEVVESYFYGWRITGQEKYRAWAWDAFTAIVNATTAEWGYSEVASVMATPASEEERRRNFRDTSESFWSAETLKYLYLTFSEPELCSLDNWVFNTEAHPLRRRI